MKVCSNGPGCTVWPCMENKARNIAHALAVVGAYARGRYDGFHMLVDLAPIQDVPGVEK